MSDNLSLNRIKSAQNNSYAPTSSAQPFPQNFDQFENVNSCCSDEEGDEDNGEVSWEEEYSEE